MNELETLTARAGELSSKLNFWNSAVLWALFITALAAAAIVVSQDWLLYVHGNCRRHKNEFQLVKNL